MKRLYRGGSVLKLVLGLVVAISTLVLGSYHVEAAEVFEGGSFRSDHRTHETSS